MTAVRKSRMLRAAVLAFLAVLTAAAFWPVLGNGFVNLDDYRYVVENGHVRSGLTWEGMRWAFVSLGYSSNWHPLTWLSHMLDVELYGLWAGGHHLTSVLIHLAVAWLLYLAVAGMTGAAWPSALVAALFAVHPLRVESVAWVAERKDVLSGAFWWGAVLAYGWYARRPGAGRYGLVALLMGLGLMAKPMLVTLPFVLLLLDFWPLGRMGTGSGAGSVERSGTVPVPSLRRTGVSLAVLFLEKLPLLLLSAASSAVTWLAQERGGAIISTGHYALGMRVTNALVAYVKYVLMTFRPVGLAVYYPHPEGHIPAWQVAAAPVVLAAVTAAAVASVARRPYILTGWLWYLGTLVPVIGLVQVGGQAMADRYTYVPLAGVLIAAVWLAGDLPVHRLAGRLAPVVGAVAGAAVIVASAAAARVHTGYWRDSRTLFEHALAVTRDNWLAHNNLAVELKREGKLKQAIGHFRQSLGLFPDNPDANFNLANALAADGSNLEAVAYYQAAVKVRPDFFEAYNNMGLALLSLNRAGEAVHFFRKAVHISPRETNPHFNMAAAYRRLGNAAEAAVEYRRVLELDPASVSARRELERLLREARRRGEASRDSEGGRP